MKNFTIYASDHVYPSDSDIPIIREIADIVTYQCNVNADVEYYGDLSGNKLPEDYEIAMRGTGELIAACDHGVLCTDKIELENRAEED